MSDRLRRRIGRCLPTSAVLLAALALGACQTTGPKPGNTAAVSPSLSSGSGSAIAFESIDGPPKPVFDRLVSSLTSEAQTRQISVVSRDSRPAYRVRGYLAAAIDNGKGEVDWVWDVFDKDQQRVLRVAGVEKLGTGKDVWDKLDDEAVNRIAARSLDEIASRLTGGEPTPETSVPQQPAAVPQPDPADAPPVREDDGPALAAIDAQDTAAPTGDIPSGTLTFAAYPAP